RHMVRPLRRPADVYGLARWGAAGVELPPNSRDHRHQYGRFRQGVPIESTFGEVADRAFFRPDAADPGQPFHRLPDGPAGLHILEHPGRICESGPVADGDMAGAVDDRHVLDVEVVGEERGPHQARLDSDAEIAATDRSLRAVQGAVEGLVAN